MVFETAGAGVLFLVARVRFDGVLAFVGLTQFMNGEGMAGCAEGRDCPAQPPSTAAAACWS